MKRRIGGEALPRGPDRSVCVDGLNNYFPLTGEKISCTNGVGDYTECFIYSAKRLQYKGLGPLWMAAELKCIHGE